MFAQLQPYEAGAMVAVQAKSRRADVCPVPMVPQVMSVSASVLCVLFIVCLSYQPEPRVMVVQVQDEGNIRRLMHLITDQREQIRKLSDRLRTLQHYHQDTPTLKYPKHASDDLTGVLIGTSDGCGNTSSLDAVVLVHSAATHFSRRERYRQAYTDPSRPYRLKLVFLIGHVRDASVQIDLELENRKHGDTLIGTFIDTYQNLTLKAVMGYRWAAEHCRTAKVIIKMDDDVFFNVAKFFDTFWHKQQGQKPQARQRSIFCNVWENAPVGRTGKWKVEKDLFANNTYHFPYCAGFFVIITTDLLSPMYQAAKSMDFFWIDDVFMYGMVPEVLGGIRFWQIGLKSRKITETYRHYKQCKKKGKISGCSYWAVLTDGDKLFDLEQNELRKHEEALKHAKYNVLAT